MTAPTWFFDGDKRRIYEVPPSATYMVDVGGYRIYGQGSGTSVMETDVKRDLWSRWVDWHATHDWALEAFSASGGNQRPTGEFAPADFSLQTAVGWRIVLANYPHETIFYGNLFAQGVDSLFDNSRLSVVGVVPRMQGSANLLTYNTGGGPGGNPADIAAAVMATILDTDLNGHPVTFLEAQRAKLRIDASKFTVVKNSNGTVTVTFRDLGDTKDSIVALFQSGNRISIAPDWT